MKGISIWILGFFTFLSVANVVNATIMWFGLGPTSDFTPYLLDSLIATIPVWVYTLISVLVMLAFLGGTAHMAVSELSVKDQVRALEEKTVSMQTSQEAQRRTLMDVQGRVLSLDENIDSTRNKLTEDIDSQGQALKESLEASNENQIKLIDGIQGRVTLFDETMNDFKKQLGKHTDAIKNIDAKVAEGVNAQMADLKDTIAKLESKNSKAITAVTKQSEEIDEIKQKLEKLETSIMMPKPMLSSTNNVEDVKGIGPNKKADLNNVGIISASDLIMADPKLVATALGSTEKTAEKMQGRAQLQMIPGMQEKDLTLLEELDIIDRKSLAMQDPIELGKKLNAVYKINLANGKVLESDKPTIEEVVSWVKHARS